ncbi:uncharacterized protein (TIGR00255 family) [Peptoniphilus koenoeneniae]|uniref:Uncharacterized protein (TIGR00255 family) n=1 Tax=Peptoniphilus koenoeneniae TaxID=507751 RepID=A0ABU0AUA8_9FIRM|nr:MULTISPECIES: YicC/YloC family endoribonuclease [Peptoniphilus]ERT59477.1 TIGR00255 family protein [Peptoniphilus sp. BV3C26]MDQ0274590.1 uncharacterized protein (TIGR00255 family) [Peptoniphilus koenoeneniae]
MKSMTGYGLYQKSDENYNVKIEIKSVNNRYAEINIRLPKNLFAIEDKIRKFIKDTVKRGKVDVFINIEYLSQNNEDIKLNIPLAKAYMKNLLDLKEELELKDPISLRDIYTFQGVVTSSISDEEDHELNNLIFQTLEGAVKKFDEFRKIEGENLKADLKEKIKNIKTLNDEIKDLAPISLEENIKKLKENIESQLKDQSLDKARLSTEVALMCDKLAIDEEITRIYSHIDQFNDIIKDTNPIGRKLDFLLQELNRESNTIGSKSTNTKIINTIVVLKSEIEKIREQIQNIE